MTVGVHTVTVAPVGGGATVDLSCLAESVSIVHGRDDTDSQPDASSCTVELSWYSPDEALPGAVEIGATLTVATTAAPNPPVTRFVGRVTDMSLGWDESGEATPDSPLAQIVATSALADLGRRVVGTATMPQELDGARVARIMTAAGISLNPAFSDPGTVQILARDIAVTDALAAAQEVATSAMGLLWQTRAGEARYADAEHRRGTTSALELDSCQILTTPTWRRTTAGIVNTLSLGYGVAADGEEQPRYAAERAESIARYGTYGLQSQTLLAAVADATALGNLILTRNSTPVWIMAALPVDVDGLATDTYAALLGLEVGDLIHLTGLPAVGSLPTTATLWVEGWTEKQSYGHHELELTVSGYCRTVPAPRWNDLPNTLLWDAAPGTWDEATCIPPGPSQGRWTDVPASLRWDQVAVSATWDTWTG